MNHFKVCILVTFSMPTGSCNYRQDLVPKNINHPKKTPVWQSCLISVLSPPALGSH